MADSDPHRGLDAEDEDDRHPHGDVGRTAGVPFPGPPPPVEAPRVSKKGKGDPVPFVAKVGKKERKLQKDLHRPLDSWERYRALTDALDEAIDLVDLADHKARFALVIMAAVNVVLFFSADSLNPLKSGSTELQIVLGVYLFIYVCVALYFFLQAIESLRPRQSQPQFANPTAQQSMQDYPLGIRFYEDILRRDVETYKKAWQDVRIGQLNAELAVQAHALAEINKAKYSALRRLYKGLQLMTLMAVGLVVLASAAQVIGTARKAGKAINRGSDVLGQATRHTLSGLKEPSGITYHPGRGRLYAVSDDGVLAELDQQGKGTGMAAIDQQVEDVVFHPPTGGLLMVSETKGELIFFDPAAGRGVRRLRIDTPAVLGQAPTERNQGFEGLAFQPDPARPGGGIVYLSHQRAPAMVIGLAIDPQATRVGAEAVISRWPTAYEDITALAWVPELGRLLAIADSQERLLVLGTDGSVETEMPLPGDQQEGLALDPSGALWIADDKDKSLLKVPGALDAIRRRINPAAEPSPSGGGLINRPQILQ